MRGEFLVFGSPQILQAEIDEVVAVLQSGWVGTGPRVTAFERQFGEYVGGSYAVGMSSCTAALHTVFVALGLRHGDEVIVPSMTFAATANAVIHAGGRPVLADVDPLTSCLDPSDFSSRITSRTRAVVPVHFAGRLCEMDVILGIAARHGLHVIEDCAHAIESLYHGRHAGTMGDAGAFSFYATKNVVTIEGGMFTTPHRHLARKVRSLSHHGLSADAWMRFGDSEGRDYDVEAAGFKYNMTDVEAALGIHQLRRVEKNLRRREEIWDRYDAAFSALPATVPAPPQPGTRHARHLYSLLVDVDQLGVTRDDVRAALHTQNIGTGVHYRALHLMSFYRRTYGYRRGDLPGAEWLSDRTVSLPLSPALTDQDVDYVIEAVTSVLKTRR